MQRLNLHDQVARSLGLRIIRGRFQPGDILPMETDLAEEFGVSRPVVREGLRQLAGKGMVEARQKRGTQVLPTDHWNQLDRDILRWRVESGLTRECMRDLIELRVMIEPCAASLAAQRATEAEIEEMRRAVAMMSNALPDMPAFLDADVNFHGQILAASHNQFFWSVFAAISAALTESIRITNSPRADNEASIRLHSRVVDAIAERAPERARGAMLDLLSDARARLDGVLFDQDDPGSTP